MSNDMTDECRPAAGAENHWFKHNDHGYRLYERISGTALGTFWMYRDFGGKSETLAAEGWTYHLPASPDDATERARLEKENARLREVADAAREVATAVDCLEAARTVPQERQFTDEIIDAAKKLADALAALTPGATR